ncbi:MAG: alpha/beta hydrolase [Alphaproteobacteria bacterium]|nr:alpha/beta hydrolase [Alphaproteobacteria bacterium]
MCKKRFGNKNAIIILVLFLTFMVCGCASLEKRYAKVSRVAEKNGFTYVEIPSDPFILTGYYKFNSPSKPLHVYIEGDGFAWVNRRTISNNPTPRDPLVLRLAALDKADNIIYIARPCQYVTPAKNPQCNNHKYWTSHRFASEVISSVSNAITFGLEKAKASSIHLVGYSGGGAVAVLVAAVRKDVKSIITVAGNLDHEILNEKANVSTLTGSLNAVDAAKDVRHIPQIHFVGAKDKIVPKFVSESYLENSGAGGCVAIHLVPNASHHKGWEQLWPSLLNIAHPCEDE